MARAPAGHPAQGGLTQERRVSLRPPPQAEPPSDLAVWRRSELICGASTASRLRRLIVDAAHASCAVVLIKLRGIEQCGTR